jgi:AcrR family transcriptional regulator
VARAGDRSDLLDGPRGRGNARGEATRELLLVTAERLFAQRGIAAVSLRAIAAEAGQANNAAVHYYFGDRERLLREIVAYRVARGEEVRARLVAELTAAPAREVRAHDVMSVVVGSLAVHLEAGDHFLAFMSRYAIERGGFSGLEATPARSSLHGLQDLLRPLVPECTEREMEERWTIMMTSAIHTLARYQTALHHDALPAPLPTLLEELVAFLTNGIEARRGPATPPVPTG